MCHFPNNFASFPQQFCFISPTICFISPTIWFISPTIWVISPNHFLISPTILCQFAPQKNLIFFWENVKFLKCGSFLAPTLHLPQWISQSVSPKGALWVSQSIRKELFMSWCAIIIQQQLLFDIVTHPKQTLTRVSVSRISQREITLGFLSPAGEMNFHVSFSSRFSRCWENISLSPLVFRDIYIEILFLFSIFKIL